MLNAPRNFIRPYHLEVFPFEIDVALVFRKVMVKSKEAFSWLCVLNALRQPLKSERSYVSFVLIINIYSTCRLLPYYVIKRGVLSTTHANKDVVD